LSPVSPFERAFKSHWRLRLNTSSKTIKSAPASLLTIPSNSTTWRAFSSDAGINVIIINVQAFNATGKDARRIYEELDDFQSRKPIDVLSANHPIFDSR